MIIVLTYGEYSDFDVDYVLQVESRETYAAGVDAYRERTADRPKMRLDKWRQGLYAWLVDTGVATVPEFFESHASTPKAQHGKEV